ncbi:hypothetical protein FACS189440_21230 [Bacteroidia bacterium]|nr:hypothetical protein FACS189440_21230 [Bacteroidia bacterium]
MITKLYRKYISQEIRDKIYELFLGKFLFFLRNLPENLKAIAICRLSLFLPATTENKLYAFMGKNGLTPCPYDFMLKYKNLSIDSIYDSQQEMYYVFHEGKKLYFPSFCTKMDAIASYRNLIIEQDIRSPHRYIYDPKRLTGKTILDMGAAEGIFSLGIIDIANHVYLFECDKNWISALNATFAPWKEKVTLISKYVSDIDDESNISIDHFLEGKEKNNLFFKMDIEGCEQAALKGAEKTLKEAHDLDYAICTYHRKNDPEEINQLLSDHHFESEFTEGFLYFDKDFRKAIIRRKI